MLNPICSQQSVTCCFEEKVTIYGFAFKYKSTTLVSFELIFIIEMSSLRIKPVQTLNFKVRIQSP